jgi:hypothetical protein
VCFPFNYLESFAGIAWCEKLSFKARCEIHDYVRNSLLRGKQSSVIDSTSDRCLQKKFQRHAVSLCNGQEVWTKSIRAALTSNSFCSSQLRRLIRRFGRSSNETHYPDLTRTPSRQPARISLVLFNFVTLGSWRLCRGRRAQLGFSPYWFMGIWHDFQLQECPLTPIPHCVWETQFGRTRPPT